MSSSGSSIKSVFGRRRSNIELEQLLDHDSMDIGNGENDPFLPGSSGGVDSYCSDTVLGDGYIEKFELKKLKKENTGDQPDELVNVVPDYLTVSSGSNSHIDGENSGNTESYSSKMVGFTLNESTNKASATSPKELYEPSNSGESGFRSLDNSGPESSDSITDTTGKSQNGSETLPKEPYNVSSNEPGFVPSHLSHNLRLRSQGREVFPCPENSTTSVKEPVSPNHSHNTPTNNISDIASLPQSQSDPRISLRTPRTAAAVDSMPRPEGEWTLTRQVMEVKITTYMTSERHTITCIVPVVKSCPQETGNDLHIAINMTPQCDASSVLLECAKQCNIEPLYANMFGLWNPSNESWILISDLLTPEEHQGILEFRVRFTVRASGEQNACRIQSIRGQDEPLPMMSNNIIKYLYNQRLHDFLKSYPIKKEKENDWAKHILPEMSEEPNLLDDKVLVAALFQRIVKDYDNIDGNFDLDQEDILETLPESSKKALKTSGWFSFLYNYPHRYMIRKRFHQYLKHIDGKLVKKLLVSYYQQKYITHLDSLEPHFNTEVFYFAGGIGAISVNGDSGVIFAVKDANLMKNVLERKPEEDASCGLKIIKNDSKEDEDDEICDQQPITTLTLDFKDFGDVTLMDDVVHMSDILGQQLTLSFEDNNSARSFLECIEGYYKLLVNPYCYLSSTSSRTLSKMVHGPVTEKYLRNKLASDERTHVCGYRQTSYDDYEMIIKIPKDSESIFKCESIKQDGDTGALKLGSLQESFSTIDDVITFFQSNRCNAAYDNDVILALRNIVRPKMTGCDKSGLTVQRSKPPPSEIDEDPRPRTIQLKDISYTLYQTEPDRYTESSVRYWTGSSSSTMREVNNNGDMEDDQDCSDDRKEKRKLVVHSSIYSKEYRILDELNTSIQCAVKKHYVVRYHCNIARQLGATDCGSVFEYSEAGNIVEYFKHRIMTKGLVNDGGVIGYHLIQIFYQLAHALRYYESKNLAYGTLNASKIILFRCPPANPLIKLNYSGITSSTVSLPREERSPENQILQEFATLESPWVAPEYCTNDNSEPRQKEPTNGGDVWSFATTICEILHLAQKGRSFGKRKIAPAYETSEELMAQHQTEIQVIPDWLDCSRASGKRSTERFSAILRQCWSKDPEQRPKFHTILQSLSELMHHEVGGNKFFLTPTSRTISPGQILQRLKRYNPSDLHFVKNLGSGHYGMVEQYRYKNTDKFFAIKSIKGDLTREQLKNFHRELQTMADLKHENIVKVKGFTTSTRRHQIVLEYLPDGDIKEFLDRKSQWNNKCLLIGFCMDIAEGLRALHRKGVLHRDLAPRNVLVGTREDESYIAKISDFGLSGHFMETNIDYWSHYDQSYFDVFPIKWYAPECLDPKKPRIPKLENYTYNADIWSYGLTIWRLWCPKARMICPDELLTTWVEELKSGKKMCKMSPRPPREIEELMYKCWELKPEDRINLDDIVERLKHLKQLYGSPTSLNLR
ncbi:tyrosine-protein kinase JAK2-like [Styela clava]